jgi:putative transcriptional regulator|tara:strand:+ start:1072 stop:1659 length:588 start_codon:yes stop_codon:yes gene_type:complete
MKEIQSMSDDSSQTTLNGQFLVSMPDLKDGVFDSALVLMCEHGESGAMGFIVNKPTEFSVQEIFEQLGLESADSLDPDVPVMTGGPVEPQRGFLLSNHPITEDVVEVLNGLYLASSPDVLPLATNALNQGDAIFILGYSGWSEGQLESEMAANTWINVPWNSDVIFQIPTTDRQRAALAQLGIDPIQLAQGAGHA